MVDRWYSRLCRLSGASVLALSLIFLPRAPTTAMASDYESAVLERSPNIVVGLSTRGEASRYEKAVLDKKPVAYWRLGEGKGPEGLDRTGNGHKGICCGTVVFHEEGGSAGGKGTPRQ